MIVYEQNPKIELGMWRREKSEGVQEKIFQKLDGTCTKFRRLGCRILFFHLTIFFIIENAISAE
jgi:hypothetical protein